MATNNNLPGQSRAKITIAQKTSIGFLITVFLILIMITIYDQQYVDFRIITSAVIVVFVVFISVIYVIFRRLINQLNKAELLSITDELTQFFNRTHFKNILENELNRAVRYNRELSCIIINIDSFKKINDKYGHQFGDDILREASEVLKDNLRTIDIVARYDGNKFICLLPETENELVIIISKRLQAIVGREPFYYDYIDNSFREEIHITISIGVTSYIPRPDDEIDIHKIINMADKALNLAKESGENTMECLLPSNTES